jgi:ABC-type glycerol-3-phosphate transport system substrate-binding protein
MSHVGVQIEYWSVLSRFSIDAKQYVKDVINRFETRTGAKVNIKFKRHEDIVDGTYKTLFDGGTVPDIFDCSTHLTADFIHAGQLRDLASVYDQFDGTLNIAIAHFDVLRAQQNIHCGKTKYDVPILWWDPGAFLIRKDHMDNAGLTPADFGTTEGFITSLEAIKDAGITEYPFQIVGNINCVGHGLFMSLLAAEGANAIDGNYFDGLLSPSLLGTPAYLPHPPPSFIPVFGASDGFTNTVRTNVLSWWASLIHGHPTASGKILTKPNKDKEDHLDAIGRFASGKTSCVCVPAPYRGAVLRLMSKELSQGKITWLPSLRTDKLLNDDGTAEYDTNWPVPRPAILMHALAHYCPVQTSPDADKEAAAQEFISEFMTYDNQYELATIAGPPARQDVFNDVSAGSGELQEFLNAYSQHPLLTADEEFSSTLYGSWFGYVEDLPPGLIGTWIVGSKAFIADIDTEFIEDYGPLMLNMWVHIFYSVGGGGTQIIRIETLPFGGATTAPTTAASADGTATLALSNGNTLNYTITTTYTGTIAFCRLYRAPFDSGQVVAILYDGTGPIFDDANPLVGDFVLSPADVALLLNGGLYVQIDVTASKTLKIRGHVSSEAVAIASPRGWYNIQNRYQMEGALLRTHAVGPSLAADGVSSAAVAANWVAAVDPFMPRSGDEAINILGATGFGVSTNYDGTPTPTANNMSAVRDMLYVAHRDQLWVLDRSFRRIQIFDLSGGITDGMSATYVFGVAAGNDLTQVGVSPDMLAMAYDETNKRLYLVIASEIYVYDDSGVNPVVGTPAITNPAFLYKFAIGANINDLVIDEVAQKLYVSTIGETPRVRIYDVSSGVSASYLGAYGVYNPITGFENWTIFWGFAGVDPLGEIGLGAGPLMLDPVHNRISVANCGELHDASIFPGQNKKNNIDATGFFGRDRGYPHVVTWDTGAGIPAVPGNLVGEGGIIDRTCVANFFPFEADLNTIQERYGQGTWTYPGGFSASKMLYYPAKDQVIVAEAGLQQEYFGSGRIFGTSAVKIWSGRAWRGPWDNFLSNDFVSGGGGDTKDRVRGQNHLYSFGYRKTPAPPVYPGTYNSFSSKNPTEKFAIEPGSIALDNARGHLFVVYWDRVHTGTAQTIRVFNV